MVELVSLHLKDLGYDVESESDGSSGLQKALEHEYLLIVLDVMLPKTDGLEVCRRIRAANSRTPVLMLTAKSEELDKVLGLEMGADDYLTKPFSVKEFIARVKALVRRTSPAEGGEKEKKREVMRSGGLVIDTEKRSVSVDGRPIELTAKEFDLLFLFVRNPGRAFNRQQLLDLVWGYQFEGYNHTVNTHINRLRTKIEKDPSNPVYIQTVWGYGYRFTDRTELMLYRFRKPDGTPILRYRSGTLVSRNGTGTLIRNFTADPGTRVLDAEGHRWPLDWLLRIPSARLTLSLRSFVPDQLVRGQLLPTFWEGAAAVTGTKRGICFVEETNA